MFGAAPAEVALDEGVDGTVEDRIDVAEFDVRSEILHHLIGLQDVGANLAAPASLDVLSADLVELSGLFLPGQDQQLRFQHLHRPFPVLQLGTLVLTRRHEPGRKVGDANRRIGRVHVLASGALGSERVDTKVVGIDLDLNVLVTHVGDDVNPGKCGVATRLRIEWADTNESVGSALALEVAVCPVAANADRGRLDPGFLTLGELFPGDSIALVGEVSLVHPKQHLGPVLGIHASRTRVHGEDRRMLVVLAKVERLQLKPVEFLRHLLERLRRLDKRVCVTELDEDLRVVQRLLEVVDQGEDGLVPVELLGYDARFVGVVPELGLGDRLSQFLEFRRLLIQVKETPWLRAGGSAGRRCRGYQT